MDVQLGVGGVWGSEWAPLPATKVEAAFVRGFTERLAFAIRAEGIYGPFAREGDRSDVTAHAAGLGLTLRHRLGRGQRGFAELGTHVYLAILHEEFQAFAGPVTQKSVEFRAEYFTFSVGLALLEDHNLDVGFRVGIGSLSHGALFIRAPLWHRD